MNSTGGGLTHVSHIHSEEMRVFRGGLRHLPVHSELLQHNSKINLHNFHDKLSYERGFIQHSRSPSNQHINFHYMYGGVQEYFFQRFLKQGWYRKNVRNWWFPVLLSYSLGCFCMRLYDNASHDYFYFTD